MRFRALALAASLSVLAAEPVAAMTCPPPDPWFLTTISLSGTTPSLPQGVFVRASPRRIAPTPDEPPWNSAVLNWLELENTTSRPLFVLEDADEYRGRMGYEAISWPDEGLGDVPAGMRTNIKLQDSTWYSWPTNCAVVKCQSIEWRPATGSARRATTCVADDDGADLPVVAVQEGLGEGADDDRLSHPGPPRAEIPPFDVAWTQPVVGGGEVGLDPVQEPEPVPPLRDVALHALPVPVRLVHPADVLALDGDRGHPPLVDRLKEVAEGDLGLARLLLGHDRPQQEAHQQEEQPEAEIAGDGVQAHTTDTGTL